MSSCVIQMDPPEPVFDLANLPLDIIRRILSMEGNANVRLISPSWNAIFCTLRRLKPLQRVYLYTGIPEDKKYSYSSDRKTRMRNLKIKEQIHMYSIMSERDSFGLGIGGWLKVHNRQSGGYVEVTCDPMLIGGFIADLTRSTIVLTVCNLCYMLAFIWLFVIPVFHINNITIWLWLSPFIALVSAAIAFNRAYLRGCGFIEMKHGKKRARLARFFSEFAHIETLVIENFHPHPSFVHGYGVRVMDAVEKTLKGVKIDRVEIRESCFNDAVQYRVLNLCRNHSIRHVSMIFNRVALLVDIEEFVTEILKLGVTLDFFEFSLFNGDLCWSIERKYWDDIANGLKRNNIRMTLTTNCDATFNADYYDSNVKTHVRCEMADETIDRPLKRSRGFTHNW